MSALASACTVKSKTYFDSVFLMQLAKTLSDEPGVLDAAAVMGTDANKELLLSAGFVPPDTAAADDLVVCVHADSGGDAQAALEQLEALLTVERGARQDTPRTLDDALTLEPALNIAVISVPGEHAAREARRAIERGLHVFLFSSGVELEDEIELKRRAAERGLVVMGPDCGTSIIAGTGLGFANAVRRGPIGIVGASGTGIQAISSLVHRLGSGVSHAIGTGSRDLSDEVGGVTALAGMRALGRDPTTDVIVLVAKAVGPDTRARLRSVGRHLGKPVVTCFLAEPGTDARTLREAAEIAVARQGEGDAQPPGGTRFDAEVEEAGRAMSDGQRYIRGIFAGGTLCAEAQRILHDRGLPIRSNAPLRPAMQLDDQQPRGHVLLDMGVAEYTSGRPHPMIDPRLRRERLVAEALRSDVAVILLDVVLGYGAAADPAGDLADAIGSARDTAGREGRHLSVVASICGTDLDPQGLDGQRKTLEDAGAMVFPTSAEAATAAARLVEARP